MRDVIKETAELLGENSSSSFWRGVDNVFDTMEIAEEEIARAQKKYPSHEKQIYDSFIFLRPMAFLGELSVTLYRPHVKEILERVVWGQDTTLATKAELIALFYHASLKSPLTHSGTGLYLMLFKELFPNEASHEKWFGSSNTDPLAWEDWQGQYDEILGREQNKLRQEWRK